MAQLTGQPDLRRNGNGLGSFWREYNGVVPLIVGAAGAITAASIGGLTGAIHSLGNGAVQMYGIDPAGAVKTAIELYKVGANTAGSYLLPGFLAGQFVGYKFKKAVKPILGLK